VCERFDEPARCTACCLSPWEHGLSPTAAWLGRRLEALGALSPLPNLPAFQNRLDVVAGGLLSAQLVTAPDAADLARLEQLGVPRRDLRLLADDAPADQVLALYAECTAERGNGRS
jgi:hypothetical protein